MRVTVTVVVVVVVHVQAPDHIHSPLCTVLPLLLHATFRYFFQPKYVHWRLTDNIETFEIDHLINISGRKRSFCCC